MSHVYMCVVGDVTSGEVCRCYCGSCCCSQFFIPGKMSHQKKRHLEEDQKQEDWAVRSKRTSLVSDCLRRAPIVQLYDLKLEFDHQNKKRNVKKPECGQRSNSGIQDHPPDDNSADGRISPSPLVHNELLDSDVDIRNNQDEQQSTAESRVCTSPPKECMKVPVVRLFRLKTQAETPGKESTNESDREQHHDQELQTRDPQEGPRVHKSYTSLEAMCRRKQPVVRLSRLEMQHEEQQLSILHSEQCSDQVLSSSNSETHDGTDPPLVAQSAVIHSDKDFTREHDQQDDPETVCRKQPVVRLNRLNIEPKHHLEREVSEDDSEQHFDHVQSHDSSPPSEQSEDEEEHSMDESDGIQLDEEDLQMFSEYELERLKNIKQNAKFLKSLNLMEVASTLCQQQKSKPRVKREKPQSDAGTRQSMRLQGITPLVKLLEEKKQFRKPQVIPPGPLKMFPSNDVNHGAWAAFKNTWKSISKGKFPRPSRIKCKTLPSYENRVKSLTLEERAVTCIVPGTVSTIAIHPSKTRTLVAAGDFNGNVGLWDLKNQSAGVYVFPLHSGKTISVCFSPSNAKHLLTLGRDGAIRRGDVSHAVFDEIYRDESCLASSFDFLTSNSSVFILSHFDSKLSVVDCRTPTNTSDVCGQLSLRYVRSVNVHPLRRDYCLVTGSSQAYIYDVRMLNAEMTQPVVSLLGHNKDVISAAFSPRTGKRVLTCSLDQHVRVFRIRGFAQTTYPFTKIRIKGEKNILPVFWDPKQENCFGQCFMAQRKIEIYHVKGQLVHTLSSSHLPARTFTFAFHPTRNLLVAGTIAGTVGVWKKWKNRLDPPEEGKSLE
ncbi:WD repeat-containing protein 76 [Leptodactylus fuscus]|uniref:WD repeat-containing protein 76 n=1 Tax=Leptodactylus fuscus TaxID=238119 RepID=UPI003F4F2A7C